jgi:DNA repair exonuclease SbcCD nuclease subunit
MSEVKIAFTLRPGYKGPRFIASADIHLGKKLYNFPELEDDLRDNLSRLVDLAIEKKVKYLVIAGDLFDDNHAKVHTIAFVTRLVEKLKANGIQLLGITGDHDKSQKGESWMRISGIDHVKVVPEFSGLDYFDYSQATPEELIASLAQDTDQAKVSWVFLHCQFPQVFDKTEPKKGIDFNKLMLFDTFPNIQGVIAGDLHYAPETRAYGINREAYVGYPGSLGIVDISEADSKKSVLYCDGTNLVRLPFPQRRIMTEINFRGKTATDFDVMEQVDWAKAQTFKPVIKVIWDSDSDPYLSKLTPLYEVALVKMQQVKLSDPMEAKGEDEAFASRSEATTDDKIETALRYFCENDEGMFTLANNLLKGDAKEVLDTFKESYEL